MIDVSKPLEVVLPDGSVVDAVFVAQEKQTMVWAAWKEPGQDPEIDYFGSEMGMRTGYPHRLRNKPERVKVSGTSIYITETGGQILAGGRPADAVAIIHLAKLFPDGIPHGYGMEEE